MKKILLIWITLLFLTGCWDRSEVNDMAYVTETGFDKVGDNQFRVSVQVPLPGDMGESSTSGGGGGTGGGPYYVDSGIGRNVRESNDDLQKRMSRELYFGHRRILIFGEELARFGFQKSLDVVLEQPQSRLSSYVYVTKGEALNILNATPHFEQLPSEALREMAKAQHGYTVKDVLNDIAKPGKDPVIHVAMVKETQNGESEDKKDELMVDGFGVLKGDKLKFFSNKEETNGILWLTENFVGRNYTYVVGEKDELNITIKSQTADLKMNEDNEIPEFSINISVEAEMMQNEPNLNLDNEEDYNLAVGNMKEQIKSEVTSILEHSTKEGIDIYGLGWYLFRNHNFLWEDKFKDRWEEVLPELEVNVNVNAEIKRTINSGLNIKE